MLHAPTFSSHPSTCSFSTQCPSGAVSPSAGRYVSPITDGPCRIPACLVLSGLCRELLGSPSSMHGSGLHSCSDHGPRDTCWPPLLPGRCLVALVCLGSCPSEPAVALLSPAALTRLPPPPGSPGLDQRRAGRGAHHCETAGGRPL